MAKTRDNGYKMYWEKFHLNIRKKLFYHESNQSQEQPPRGRGGDPSGGFQDMTGQGARSSHLGSLPTKEWTWQSSQAPSNPGCSIWFWNQIPKFVGFFQENKKGERGRINS